MHLIIVDCPMSNGDTGRSARFEDPFGHVWIVATHVEDVSLTELQRRWDEMS